MTAFASATVMTGPADPAIEVSVAGRLAGGVWTVLCIVRAPVGLAGAVAVAPADPADPPATPGTADCIVMWANKNPKELTGVV